MKLSVFLHTPEDDTSLHYHTTEERRSKSQNSLAAEMFRIKNGFKIEFCV